MIELQLLRAGSCRQSEWLSIRGGDLKSIEFPALFALLRHPTLGPILYDTGYAPRFFDETQRFPARFYRWLTPTEIDPSETAVAQLRRLGIEPGDVKLIILSHFHADHVGGLRDFPEARFLYLPEAWSAVAGLSGFAALRAAFLPGLLPPDFLARSLPAPRLVDLPESLAPFETGYDLLGDGSLLGLRLDGHATGQLGIIVGDTLLCADAAWSSRAVREKRPPHPLARLIMADPEAYAANFGALHELHRRNPGLRIIASHCGEVEVTRC